MSAMRFRYRRGLNGYGGYRGKERLNRDRSRASRYQAQQTIDEYLDADEPGERRIRIGHRAEFYPTAGTPDVDVVSQSEQMDLPLDERARTPEPSAADYRQSEPVIRLHAARAPVDAPASVEPVPDTKSSGAQPAERPRRAPYEWFADRQPARPKTFQRGNFLYGCALGTAAAAVILAMLRVAFM